MNKIVCGHCGRSATAEKTEDGEILLCDCYFNEGCIKMKKDNLSKKIIKPISSEKILKWADGVIKVIDVKEFIRLLKEDYDLFNRVSSDRDFNRIIDIRAGKELIK